MNISDRQRDKEMKTENSKRNIVKKVDVIKASRIATPLGALYACANPEGVCLLEFLDSAKLESRISRIEKMEKTTIVDGRNAWLTQLRCEIGEYFKNPNHVFTVPLHLPGTEFQRSVWRQLIKTTAGELLNYSGLAAKVGHPKAIRAAAAANGSNPVSILVPCHRVVGTSGELTGYGGGLERKAWLLNHEGIEID